ncbi:MAG: PEP-CTERM sorting domain-containing protein [Proteobacteria bacterium]|nr:PEP-CTERM sorting domain-containing protein [Desulfobulbaceae bacterium]MBU4153387.1 PEP-CTERM sorting domain-containing protein [Pseudomonadota bacterium]
MKRHIGLFLGILLLTGAKTTFATSYYYTFEVTSVSPNNTGIPPASIIGHKYIFFVDPDRNGFLPSGASSSSFFYAHLMNNAELARLTPEFLSLIGVVVDTLPPPFDPSKYGNILFDEYSDNNPANTIIIDWGSSDSSIKQLESTRTPVPGSYGDKNHLFGLNIFKEGNMFTMQDYGEILITYKHPVYKKDAAGKTIWEGGNKVIDYYEPDTYAPQFTLLQTTVKLTHITPVPEPATFILFGSGLTGLVAARRKKKSRAKSWAIIQ